MGGPGGAEAQRLVCGAREGWGDPGRRQGHREPSDPGLEREMTDRVGIRLKGEIVRAGNQQTGEEDTGCIQEGCGDGAPGFGREGKFRGPTKGQSPRRAESEAGRRSFKGGRRTRQRGRERGRGAL